MRTADRSRTEPPHRTRQLKPRPSRPKSGTTMPAHRSNSSTDGPAAGQTSEARIAKALAHPLRSHSATPRRARRQPRRARGRPRRPLGVLAYHVRMLREYDCVELVRTEPRRGALQHYYKATARAVLDAEQRRSLPAALRGELSGATLRGLIDDLAAGADAGALADPETVVTRTLLELDERGWRKLTGCRRARTTRAWRSPRRARRERRRDASRPSWGCCTSSAPGSSENRAAPAGLRRVAARRHRSPGAGPRA
jgi:hypothetical protein